MKKLLTIAGGVITAISVFFPFTTIFGKSMNFIDLPNGDAPVWIACGVIIAVVGLINKRWLNILSLVLGLSAAGMALYYNNKLSGFTGSGIAVWALLVGGILSVAGSINGLRSK